MPANGPDWSHQPKSVGFTACPVLWRPWVHNIEWSREWPDLIEKVKEIRQGKTQPMSNWEPSLIAEYWPDTATLDIPEDILARQITIWQERSRPKWLEIYRSYLHETTAHQIRLDLPSLLELSPSLTPQDAFDLYSQKYPRKKGRDLLTRYTDQLRDLTLLRLSRSLSEEAILRSTVREDDKAAFSDLRSLQRALKRARKIRELFILRAMSQTIRRRKWFPPFGAWLVPPLDV
jgi:hypothetical protein